MKLKRFTGEASHMLFEEIGIPSEILTDGAQELTLSYLRKCAKSLEFFKHI